MVFNDDATLMSLFNIYEDESDLKDAVLKYVKDGAVVETNEIAQPTDSDLDFIN
jgi:hypothetical protein